MRTDAAMLAQALALIGQPRTLCAHCGAPSGSAAYGGTTHTPRSAALAVGVDPQAVYRAVRKRDTAQANPPQVPAQPSQP